MVQAKRKDNLGALLEIRGHHLSAGVSEKLGGRGEGPDPHEYLEAALASCTVITVQMYANRKQWNLTSTDVRVQITEENKEFTKITREIHFRGDLTEEQKERLFEIAEKCPIHRLLSGTVEVDSKLIKSAADVAWK